MATNHSHQPAQFPENMGFPPVGQNGSMPPRAPFPAPGGNVPPPPASFLPLPARGAHPHPPPAAQSLPPAAFLPFPLPEIEEENRYTQDPLLDPNFFEGFESSETATSPSPPRFLFASTPSTPAPASRLALPPRPPPPAPTTPPRKRTASEAALTAPPPPAKKRSSFPLALPPRPSPSAPPIPTLPFPQPAPTPCPSLPPPPPSPSQREEPPRRCRRTLLTPSQGALTLPHVQNWVDRRIYDDKALGTKSQIIDFLLRGPKGWSRGIWKKDVAKGDLVDWVMELGREGEFLRFFDGEGKDGGEKEGDGKFVERKEEVEKGKGKATAVVASGSRPISRDSGYVSSFSSSPAAAPSGFQPGPSNWADRPPVAPTLSHYLGATARTPWIIPEDDDNPAIPPAPPPTSEGKKGKKPQVWTDDFLMTKFPQLRPQGWVGGTGMRWVDMVGQKEEAELLVVAAEKKKKKRERKEKKKKASRKGKGKGKGKEKEADGVVAAAASSPLPTPPTQPERGAELQGAQDLSRGRGDHLFSGELVLVDEEGAAVPLPSRFPEMYAAHSPSSAPGVGEDISLSLFGDDAVEVGDSSSLFGDDEEIGMEGDVFGGGEGEENLSASLFGDDDDDAGEEELNPEHLPMVQAEKEEIEVDEDDLDAQMQEALAMEEEEVESEEE